MRQILLRTRMALGGCVWGGLFGAAIGAIAGTVFGLLSGDISFGLDGAVVGGGLGIGCGGLYGVAVSLEENRTDSTDVAVFTETIDLGSDPHAERRPQSEPGGRPPADGNPDKPTSSPEHQIVRR